MQHSPGRHFSLCLSDGRALSLAKGTSLIEKDLPGLHSTASGGAVAMVNPHPTDPNICGLQNVSHLPWTARLGNGTTTEIKPGKSIRLTPGTRIDFGEIKGEVADGGARAVSRRRLRWMWAMLAGLVGLCFGGWLLQRRHALEAPHDQRDVFKLNVPPQKVLKERAVDEKPKPPDEVKLAGGRLPDNLYGLQDYITFDCLDGVAIDPKSGGVSLFGHRSAPGRLRAVPYFDYLATALECKEPAFTLEWKPSSASEAASAMKTGGEVILNAFTKLFDEDYHLTVLGAWLLQQYGVHAFPGMSQSTTLAWMLVATRHEKTALVVERFQVWSDAKGTEGLDALRALCTALGSDAAYREMQEQWQSGAASEEKVKDIFYPSFFAALSAGLESGNTTYASLYRQSRSSGRTVSQAVNDALKGIGTDFLNLIERSLNDLSAQTPEIEIPYSLVANVKGVRPPMITPVFLRDLPPRSLLARTAFMADVAGKLLGNAPELKESVPGYQTESEFFRANGGSWGGFTRYEFGPGQFELIESPEGNRIRFGATPMIVTVRASTGGPTGSRHDLDDPIAARYGMALSAQYDALAEVIPILHELREVDKVIAVARWLQMRGFKLKMPLEGRGDWTPPEEFPGMINFSLSIKGTAVVVSSSASGGVPLNPEKMMRFRKANGIDDFDNLRDAVADVVAAGNGAEAAEKNLRTQLSKATTPQEKAALEIQLFHLLALKGDKQGATQAWDQAMAADPKAASQAERDFQNHGAPTTSGGGAAVQRIDEYMRGVENLKKGFSTENPFGPFQFRPKLPQPPAPDPKLMEFFEKNPEIRKEEEKKHPELSENFKKRQELEAQINKPETTPDISKQITEKVRELDQKTAATIEKIKEEVKKDHPEQEL